MPSGPKKRKAAKKKILLQQQHQFSGNLNDNNNNNNNLTGTEVKQQNEQKSDCSEVAIPVSHDQKQFKNESGGFDVKELPDFQSFDGVSKSLDNSRGENSDEGVVEGCKEFESGKDSDNKDLSTENFILVDVGSSNGVSKFQDHKKETQGDGSVGEAITALKSSKDYDNNYSSPEDVKSANVQAYAGVMKCHYDKKGGQSDDAVKVIEHLKSGKGSDDKKFSSQDVEFTNVQSLKSLDDIFGGESNEFAVEVNKLLNFWRGCNDGNFHTENPKSANVELSDGVKKFQDNKNGGRLDEVGVESIKALTTEKAPCNEILSIKNVKSAKELLNVDKSGCRKSGCCKFSGESEVTEKISNATIAGISSSVSDQASVADSAGRMFPVSESKEAITIPGSDSGEKLLAYIAVESSSKENEEKAMQVSNGVTSGSLPTSNLAAVKTENKSIRFSVDTGQDSSMTVVSIAKEHEASLLFDAHRTQTGRAVNVRKCHGCCDDQPSAQQEVRKTPWWNCCGLFEAAMSSDR